MDGLAKENVTGVEVNPSVWLSESNCECGAGAWTEEQVLRFPDT